MTKLISFQGELGANSHTACSDHPCALPRGEMMRYLHLDVFTSRPFEGNQLAVFPEPSGLSTETMQAIKNHQTRQPGEAA